MWMDANELLFDFWQMCGSPLTHWDSHEEWETLQFISPVEGSSAPVWKQTKGI
jgi:hypothetical protein